MYTSHLPNCRRLSAQLHAGAPCSAQDKAELESIDDKLAAIHNQMPELNNDH